jgi:hypothetical protein
MSTSLRRFSSFLAVARAVLGHGQPTALDLFELALFDRIGAVFGKFPSLRGTAVELYNLLCTAHECSSRQTGALRDSSLGEMSAFASRLIKLWQSGKPSVLLINKNILPLNGNLMEYFPL